MKVCQLIEKLKEFPQDLEVRVSDGIGFHFYRGDFEVVLFYDADDSKTVDIGVGGCEE